MFLVQLIAVYFAGALSEQGPIHIRADGKLYPNPFAWNLKTNMIFLESPAGVGFSYNTHNNYKTGDRETAENNHAALRSFFRKFPHLAAHDFYIAGESYGGIYVPTLSVLVHDRQFPANFKGFAVGNGYLDENLLGNSLLFFGNYHGLYDDVLWGRLVGACCAANISNPRFCDFVNNRQPACRQVLKDISKHMTFTKLNIYNIYSKCDNDNNNNNNGQLKRKDVGLSRQHVDYKLAMKATFGAEAADLLKDVHEDIPCMNYDYVQDWINVPAVRAALHITSKSLPWTPCSSVVSEYYHNEYTSMREQFRYLLDRGGLKALIYNGDVDAACNFIGDKWFAESLGYNTTLDYQPWFVNQQVAGYVKVFEKFAYTTVRGSGHMVPTDRPAAALKMFYKFLSSN